MKTTYNQFLNETLIYEKLESGLDIYIIKKENFRKKYAFFGSRYGGMSNVFRLGDEEITMPAGIAHFLEHQIFEDSGESTFEKFEKMGASVNAYTSNQSTVYYFDCIDEFEKGIGYLMEMVQHTAITEQTVEKEKGIIVQEINMYRDELDWELTMNLYRSLYHIHPIKGDIAGTEESVTSTSLEQILQCYKTFYNPHNMVVFIYGDVDVDDIIKTIDMNQTEEFKARNFKPEVIFPEEPYRVAMEKKSITRNISKDRFLLGYKSNLKIESSERERYLAALRIANDLMFGRSSNFFKEAISKGYVTEGIDMDVQIGHQYAFGLFGAETKYSPQLIKLIQQTLESAYENGLDANAFESNKRKLIGRMLISFNSLQSLASNFTFHKMKDGNLFDYVDSLQTLELEDINNAVRAFYDLDNYAISEMIAVEE